MGNTSCKMLKGKRQIDVQFQYLEDLTQVNFDVLSVDGKPLSGQDILDAIAETILLKWDNYDLTETKEEDLDS